MNDNLILIPETTLSDGRVVPAFRAGAYHCSRGPDGLAQITAEDTPWVRISYHEARAACAASGGTLMTESQAIALALHLADQAENWTGCLYQGLHKGTVDSPMPGTFEPEDPWERRWHVTATGDRIYDAGGNVLSWVFDDIQGDENGLVARAFDENSPSISAAPFPSRQRGMGWYPPAGWNWSGYALLRGGCWDGDALAGVFRLGDGGPVSRDGFVGFRCTFGL
ncbi:hypothetical protein [Thauera sp.]|uniref:hypothetical protein n=1 Tax=Thauera sp. TaxID=1905334 RepID=UPI0039E6B2FF